MDRVAFSFFPGGFHHFLTRRFYMLIRSLAATLTLFCVPAFLWADENPYKNAAKGQWASYKMVMKFAGQEITGSVKQTVVDKTDKEVTIEAVANIFGQEQSQKHTIDLTKPFDPLATTQLPPGADVKVEKAENGKEKIKVAGKDHETEWIRFKMTLNIMGQDINGEAKVWQSKEIPLGGIAKMTMKMNFMGNDMEMAMELENSGKE